MTQQRTALFSYSLCFIFLFIFGCSSPRNYADYLITAGKIYTLDDAMPEAKWMAVKDQTILAIGSLDEVAPFIGPETDTIREDGKVIYPGFTDGHAHFLGIGESLQILPLHKASSWEEIIEMVSNATKTTPKGTWILGRGWHQEKWKTIPKETLEGYPFHDALSAVSPEHPVLLEHASGHALFANERAMQAGLITKELPNPEGGIILRDERGNATGVFQETAAGLIEAAYESWRQQLSDSLREVSFMRAVTLAGEACLSNGITSFHDAGVSLSVIERYKALAGQDQLPVRLWVMLSARESELERALKNARVKRLGDSFLTVNGIKEYMDGALGSRGAWLLAPYADLPSSVGQPVRSTDSIEATARLAKKYDVQLCTHAIGDRANRETLDLYERVLAGETGRRWRIEHAQHLSKEDIPRFAKLGVIASMQGIHCTSDAPFVIKRLAALRAEEGAYVWKSLLQSGATVSNGTDAPVEEISPLACFYASVTRKLPDGTVFFPGESMSRVEALKSYTLYPAYSAFEEDIKGTLSSGKLADFIVLDTDLFTCSDEDIIKARVLKTYIGGRLRYTSEK